jgi:hypothetical protein
MTTPFTPVNASYDPFKIATYNELVLAFRERVTALSSYEAGWSAELFSLGLVAAGDDAHKVASAVLTVDPAVWPGAYRSAAVGNMQELAELLAGGYVSPAQPTVPYTPSTLLAAAGLPSGWRRATEWAPPALPVYLYGRAQAGDIFGPWIIEDLQVVLSALKVTGDDGGRTWSGGHWTPWLGLWPGRPFYETDPTIWLGVPEAADIYTSITSDPSPSWKFNQHQAEATVNYRVGVPVSGSLFVSYPRSWFALTWNFTLGN